MKDFMIRFGSRFVFPRAYEAIMGKQVSCQDEYTLEEAKALHNAVLALPTESEVAD